MQQRFARQIHLFVFCCLVVLSTSFAEQREENIFAKQREENVEDVDSASGDDGGKRENLPMLFQPEQIKGSTFHNVEQSGRRHDHRPRQGFPWNYRYKISREPLVERIECPTSYTTFKSWIAVEFKGQLRRIVGGPGRYDDKEDLAVLLLDAFKTESALRCDPYQRSILSAEYVPFQEASLPVLAASDSKVALFRIHVLSFGGVPPSVPTALEPDPARFVLPQPYTLTGPHCEISEILDNSNFDFNKKDHCPRYGCYCPFSTIQSNNATAGPTQAQLATALDSRLEDCQKYASALGRSGKWNLWDNRGRKGEGRKGRKQHVAKKRRRGVGRKGRKQHRAKKYGTCLPKVDEITSVIELQQVEEQCGEEVLQEVESRFQVSVPACDTFDEALFPQFVEEFRQEYNRIQFETCDPLFRRIENIDIQELCGGDGNMFSFAARGTTTTTEPTDLTSGNRRRRHRRHRKLTARMSGEAGSFSTLLEKRKIEFSRGLGRVVDRDNTHPTLISRVYNDNSLCFCSAFPSTETFGPEDFVRVAQEIFLRVIGTNFIRTAEFETPLP